MNSEHPPLSTLHLPSLLIIEIVKCACRLYRDYRPCFYDKVFFNVGLCVKLSNVSIKFTNFRVYNNRLSIGGFIVFYNFYLKGLFLTFLLYPPTGFVPDISRFLITEHVYEVALNN